MILRNTLDSKINFTRTTSGSQFNEDGSITLVGPNEPRLDYDATTGEFKGVAVEENRDNLLTNTAYPISVALENDGSGWDYVGILTKHVPSIFKGYAAYEMKNQSGAYLYQNGIGNFTGNLETTTIIVEQQDNTTHQFRVYDETAASFLIVIEFDWSTNDITLLSGTGTASVSYNDITNNGPNGGRVTEFKYTYSGSVGNSKRIYPVRLWEADTYLVLHHSQHEENSFGTSPIVSKTEFNSRSSKARYFDSDGNLQEADTNVARDNHHTFTKGKWINTGLIIEDTAKNYISDISTLSSGGSRMDFRLEDGFGLQDQVSVAYYNESSDGAAYFHFGGGEVDTLSPNTEYVGSHFVKPLDSQIKVLRMNAHPNYSDNSSVSFDMETGTIQSQDPGIHHARIEEYGNGWYRIQYSFTTSSSIASETFTNLTYLEDANDTLLQVQDFSADIIKVTMSQLELGNIASTPIITSGSSITRQNDSATSTAASRDFDRLRINNKNFYNEYEGTILGEATVLDPSVNNQMIVSFGNTAGDRIEVRYTGASSNVRGDNFAAGVEMADITAGSLPVDGSTRRVATSFNSGSVIIAANGTVSTSMTNSAGRLPHRSALNQILIGEAAFGVNFNGHIKDVKYYPKFTTESELLKLTEL